MMTLVATSSTKSSDVPGPRAFAVGARVDIADGDEGRGSVEITATGAEPARGCRVAQNPEVRARSFTVVSSAVSRRARARRSLDAASGGGGATFGSVGVRFATNRLYGRTVG